MKNPLNRRFGRELRRDAGKYIALFLFLALTIGFISGWIVAGSSMIKAYNDSFEKYNVEDGHFITEEALSEDARAAVEDTGVKLYELFYKDVTLENGHVMRLYKNRAEVNLICVMDGEMPESGEIITDRLYLENNDLSIGDTLGGFTISGTSAFSDYSALFKSNTDMMFDANKFTVGIVQNVDFDALGDNIHYCYAWKNNDADLTDDECRTMIQSIEDALADRAELTGLVARADNQALQFTGDDMGGDKTMAEVMLYVVIVVLGFVFGISSRSTMEQESGTVGTLLASGYTRGELLRHYMTLPLLVTLVAAIIGNILGYTVFKYVIVAMYYHSYSLPTYVTVWSSEAFIKTTLIPCALIAAVVWLVLHTLLRLPALSFLRHELRRGGKQYVPKLRAGGIMRRFRKRIILQNRGVYAMLFVGIFLSSLLMMFGLMMTPLLDHFKDEVLDSKLANYQYILNVPTETENENAEAFCVAQLKTADGEEITVYGIHYDSEFVDTTGFPSYKTNVLVSNGFMDKYGLERGDEITLSAPFSDDDYTVTVFGSYDYPAAMAIFMDMASFNELFGFDWWFFNGYFSDEPLDDLDAQAVSSVITEADLTVVCDQLDDSMGSMFWLFTAFAVLMSILLIYLLARVVSEKNSRSISMLKILGYTRREISSLYNTATAIVVGASLILTVPACAVICKWLFRYFLEKMNGWMDIYIAPWVYPAMIALGAVSYFVVHLIQTGRLGRIPMSQALKDME